METFLTGADAVIQILRTALLSVAVVFGAICVLDWAVRTRKISPFNAVARFCRSTVDPIIAPIERRVVRAGVDVDRERDHSEPRPEAGRERRQEQEPEARRPAEEP